MLVHSTSVFGVFCSHGLHRSVIGTDKGCDKFLQKNPTYEIIVVAGALLNRWWGTDADRLYRYYIDWDGRFL